MSRDSSPTTLLLILFFGWMAAVPAAAQVATEADETARIEPAPLVVMNLAAHPDDEDGSTLAYYRQGRNAVAYSVLYTRGEGGQNEIGPELYEELGAIRTAETLRAAERLGTHVYFLNFKDFGFSKTAEETFEMWGGRDAVTERIVYLIRKLKPDVLFTNHDTVTVGPSRQHGHHQVVGLTAYDAFDLASDPAYHPEHLEEDGVDLWQPKRLFHRLWSRPADAGHDVAVPVGDVDPERGLSYAAMAAEALHEHASQGMDMFAERVASWDSTYFELYRSAADVPPTRDDLAGNLPPNREAAPEIDYWIASGRIAPLSDGAITVDDTLAVAGQTVRVRWEAEMLPDLPVRIRFFGALDTTVVIRSDSAPAGDFRVSTGHTPTVPARIYQYERMLSHPPLGYAVYDARSGDLLRGGFVRMELAPPVLLEADSDVMRFKHGSNRVEYRATVFDASIDSLTVTAALTRDEGRAVLDQRQESFAVKSSAVRKSTDLQLPAAAEEGAYTVALSAFGAGGVAGPATAADFARAVVFDVDVPEDLRVGVVKSYDNTLEKALGELGVDHVVLDSLDLATDRFDDLHTIVVDIRAYLVRQDLRVYNDRLLDWVRRGGHLVVNYQKTFEWNADQPDPFDPARNNPGNFAPYPLQLSRLRVTRESAPVTVLAAEHPIVTAPNAVEPGDWEGWVQERGLYFPELYDERYEELFSLHDPGEEPLTGSTLLADVGEGTYLYTALVWYRQLKTLHPGAYKVFANMISLPLTDRRTADL